MFFVIIKMKTPNSIEKEKIEGKLIEYIRKGSDQRLVATKPEKSENIDLIIKKRGEYNAEEISFKINSLIGVSKTEKFIEKIEQKNIGPSKNFYFLFIYFNEINQDINNIWLIPSLLFRDIAESQALAGENNLITFEAAVDAKDEYSKYLVNKNDLGDLLVQIIDSKGKIQFGMGDSIEAKTLNLKTLRNFIVEARKNIYQDNVKVVDNPRIHGSLQLEYQKSDFAYQNIYFKGSERITGEEIVYYNNKPVWGMNYIGDNPSKNVLEFLQKALFELVDTCRFGENCNFEKHELRYEDKGSGNFEKFSGKEDVYLKNKSIYSLDYQGGSIS